MDDQFTEFLTRPKPTAERPLLGLTILVVEDSRYASEAIRLMSLRSGARLRRADCIHSAERHLNVYCPTVALVDLGLPDGSGLDLIRHLSNATPRTPVILGTSGAEPDVARGQVLSAGADGFLAKPIASITAYQTAILQHLPQSLHPTGPRVAEVTPVDPDPIALREDLNHAMDLLALETPPVTYLKRFLVGIARGSDDTALESRAQDMSDPLAATDRADFRAFLSRRISAMPAAF